MKFDEKIVTFEYSLGTLMLRNETWGGFEDYCDVGGELELSSSNRFSATSFPYFTGFEEILYVF